MAAKPRVGFLGAGWIGVNRMKALAETNLIDIIAVADPAAERAAEALVYAPRAAVFTEPQALFGEPLDAVVIATPSALHADQAISALQSGLAVFCQKPLSRTAAEAEHIVRAARYADRLLAIDFSYRYLTATNIVRDLLLQGRIGDVFAIEAIFHNAYGPDKPWFYDPALAGGGCVIDLGIHLIDLILWLFDFPAVTAVDARLFKNGKRLHRPDDQVEDYASVRLELARRVDVSLACSWNLSAGRDAVIGLTLYGHRGTLAIRNVHGSFYDFAAEYYHGTTTEILTVPPDDWGGRAAAAWARQLSHSPRFDTSVTDAVTVATVIDIIYGRCRQNDVRRSERHMRCECNATTSYVASQAAMQD